MAQPIARTGPVGALVASPGRFAARATPARAEVRRQMAFRLRPTPIHDRVDA